MNNWWENLSLRERYIVFIAGFIGLVIGVDTLVLEQHRIKVEQITEDLEQARLDFVWMSEAVHRLPANANQQKKVNSGRVITFVDRQITKLKLKSNMQQMTPIGDHSVRLKLNNLEFSRALTFFDAIETALTTEEVRITPADTIGFVNLSLIVGNGQKAS